MQWPSAIPTMTPTISAVRKSGGPRYGEKTSPSATSIAIAGRFSRESGPMRLATVLSTARKALGFESSVPLVKYLTRVSSRRTRSQADRALPGSTLRR
jgi:hypothetical protein